MTYLHEAIRAKINENNKVNIVKALATIVNDINASDSDGRTALHLAAKKGFSHIISILLKVNSIDINIQDKKGKTA